MSCHVMSCHSILLTYHGLCFAACPFGTYKEFSSPDPCKPCPAHSSTKATGSMSLNACQCFEGYKGNPGNGVACKSTEHYYYRHLKSSFLDVFKNYWKSGFFRQIPILLAYRSSVIICLSILLSFVTPIECHDVSFHDLLAIDFTAIVFL